MIEEISLGEFRDALDLHPLPFSQSTVGKEYVYETPFLAQEDFKLRVLSSIDIRDDEVRPDSSDAIRVRLIDSRGGTVLLNAGSYSHVKRTKGWTSRLLGRLDELIELYPDGFQTCPGCSEGLLVVRKGKHGGFKGCTSYPECEYSEDF